MWFVWDGVSETYKRKGVTLQTLTRLSKDDFKLNKPLLKDLEIRFNSGGRLKIPWEV